MIGKGFYSSLLLCICTCLYKYGESGVAITNFYILTIYEVYSMKTYYFNRKILSYAFWGVCCMAISSGNLYSQYFFKRYVPTNTDEKNVGNGIIYTGNNFLNVGNHVDDNNDLFGHAVFTTSFSGLIDLSPRQPRDYNRVPYEDYSHYSLNSIYDTVVYGSYETLCPYLPFYEGHPATGTKIEMVGSPVTLVNRTWTTMIDPIDGSRLWDHVIRTNNGDLSTGRQVVADQEDESSFYVLSNITNANDADRILFAVTKYEWTPGSNGHQVVWSQEYDIEGYNLVAGGIAQSSFTFYDSYIAVAGTAYAETGSQRGRIFAIALNRTNGTPSSPFRVYEMNEFGEQDHFGGDFVANSLTSHSYYPDFIISGYVRKDTIYEDEVEGEIHAKYKWPLLFSVPVSTLLAQNPLPPPEVSQVIAYKYQRGLSNEPIMEGEFNCAKWIPSRGEYLNSQNQWVPDTLWSIVAVGNIGDSSTYPLEKEAIMQEATILKDDGGAFPLWVNFQGADFTQGMSPVITDAKWFTTFNVSSVAVKHVYTGYQETNGERYMVNGSMRYSDGDTECFSSPEQQNWEYYEVSTVSKTPIVEEWGIDDDEPTVASDPDIESNSCSGSAESYSISSPKLGESMPGMSTTTAFFSFANNNLTIQYYSPSSELMEYCIMDLLGIVKVKGMQHIVAGTSVQQLNIENLSSGSYIVSVKCDGFAKAQIFSIIR